MRYWIPLAVACIALGVLATPAAAHENCPEPTNRFNVTGEKTVTANFCPSDHFDNASTVGHARLDGDWIHFNAEIDARFTNPSQRWVLHELGHTLGLRHDAGGVMDYSFPDGDRECAIADSTKRVAVAYDGFEYVRLNDTGVLTLTDAWRSGNVSDASMLWAIDAWQAPGTCEVVLHTSNFDGFGGYYDRVQTASGYPVNQHAGYFYGLPSFGS